MGLSGWTESKKLPIYSKRVFGKVILHKWNMYPAYVKRGFVNHDVVCESHVTFHVKTIGWHAKPMDYIWNPCKYLYMLM